MTFGNFSVVVIGGGPAGIAAATTAAGDGASVLLVERDKRLGGKLNQAIHKGFGFTRYDDALTGPEYAFRDISALNQTNTLVLLETTVISLVSVENAFQLTMLNRHGITVVEAGAIVLATGCRQQTPFEIEIHGSHPCGLFTSGTVQYMLNVMGQLPTNKCIILGSDNLSLVTAAALTQAGSKVLGIYEPSRAPRGYLDYVNRCIFENSIDFHAEQTITRVVGTERMQGVEFARTDTNGKPVRGSENVARCDSLILSTGLLPDISLASRLGIPIDDNTNGPLCDQNRMTMIDGIYAAGNGLYVSDLVDFVTENGEIAGRCAARYFSRTRQLIKIDKSNAFLTMIPHYIDYDLLYGQTQIFFNSSAEMRNAAFRVLVDGHEVFMQKFELLRPAETQRVEVTLTGTLSEESKISVRLD